MRRGSAFWVELPLCQAPANEDSAPEAVAPTAGLAHQILLVEDDEAARSALVAVLRSWGHGCEAAASTEQGWQVFRQGAGRWTLVISDFNLPGSLDRLAFIETVRTASSVALPAILISGTMDSDLRERAQGANCVALAKPVKPMQMRSVLDQLGARPVAESGSPH